MQQRCGVTALGAFVLLVTAVPAQSDVIFSGVTDTCSTTWWPNSMNTDPAEWTGGDFEQWVSQSTAGIYLTEGASVVAQSFSGDDVAELGLTMAETVPSLIETAYSGSGPDAAILTYSIEVSGKYVYSVGEDPQAGAGCALAIDAKINNIYQDTLTMQYTLEEGSGQALWEMTYSDQIEVFPDLDVTPRCSIDLYDFEALSYTDASMSVEIITAQIGMMLTPVPEPSTLALLALGGLVLTKRRC